jgi:hypothetical protein
LLRKNSQNRRLLPKNLKLRRNQPNREQILPNLFPKKEKSMHVAEESDVSDPEEEIEDQLNNGVNDEIKNVIIEPINA